MSRARKPHSPDRKASPARCALVPCSADLPAELELMGQMLCDLSGDIEGGRLCVTAADRLRKYLKDSERLNWLIANSAYVAHARDGEACWVMMRPDEESDFETAANTTCYTARDSIDAAMRWPNTQ